MIYGKIFVLITESGGAVSNSLFDDFMISIIPPSILHNIWLYLVFMIPYACGDGILLPLI